MVFKNFKPKVKNDFKFKAVNIVSFDLRKKRIPLRFFNKKYFKKA